jgi:hypothetical protein
MAIMALNHDGSYKLIFQHKESVRDLLMQFVPAPQPKVWDFSSLEAVRGSYVTRSGVHRHGDAVWRLKLRDSAECSQEWTYLYLLLEFQSAEPDKWMALRVQLYVSLLRQDLIARKELTRDGKLPPVAPIVLYNGESRWTAALDLGQLVASVPEALAPYQSGCRYWLIDEQRYAPQFLESQQSPLAALFRLEQCEPGSDKDAALAYLIECLEKPENAGLRQDFSRVASWLLSRKCGDPSIANIKDLTEVRTMAMPIARTADWGRQLQKAADEGRVEGRVEGEAALLRRQLVIRFGELESWVEAKLASASEEDLVRLGEGLVRGKGLQELFGG